MNRPKPTTDLDAQAREAVDRIKSAAVLTELCDMLDSASERAIVDTNFVEIFEAKGWIEDLRPHGPVTRTCQWTPLGRAIATEATRRRDRGEQP